MSVEEDFAAVAAELEKLGLRNGSDFRVQGIKPPGLPGSEYVGLRQLDGGEFQVFNFDMGNLDPTLTTADFAQARSAFVRDAVELAKFHRRGPLADDPDPEMPWNEAMGRYRRQHEAGG